MDRLARSRGIRSCAFAGAHLVVGVEALTLGTVRSVARRLRRWILARRFARHVGALTAANSASAALSFIQGILVARWLGPELYGIAALVMSFPTFVYTLFDTRSSEASVKWLSEFHARGERDRVLAMCKVGYLVDLVVASIAFLVVLLTASWAAQRAVHRPELTGLLVLYGSAFIPNALKGTSYAVLASLSRFPVIAILQASATFLRVGLVLGLVLLGWQVAGVIWANALAMAAVGLLYAGVAYAAMYRTWRASWFQGDLRALKGHRREIFAFLAYNDLNALLGMIPKQLDLLLLGYLRGGTEVGFYKLAKSGAAVIAYLVSPLQSVAYPELARLWGLGEVGALRRKVQRLALYVGIPLGLAVLFGTAFVPFVLPPLVGEAYLPAVPAARFLMVGSAVWLTFFWLRPAYMAQGRVREWLFISATVAVLSVLAYPLIICRWGYMGLAIWSVAINFLGHAVAVWVLREKLSRI